MTFEHVGGLPYIPFRGTLQVVDGQLCIITEASMGAYLLGEGMHGFVTKRFQEKAEEMIEKNEAVDKECLKLEAQQEREAAAEEARAAGRRRSTRKAATVEK